MVPGGGLEPPRLSTPDPKSGASTNSATRAPSLQKMYERGREDKIIPRTEGMGNRNAGQDQKASPKGPCQNPKTIEATVKAMRINFKKPMFDNFVQGS